MGAQKEVVQVAQKAAAVIKETEDKVVITEKEAQAQADGEIKKAEDAVQATKKAQAKADVKAKVKAEVKAKVANAVSKSTLSYSDLKQKLIGAKTIVDNIITEAEKTKANAESAVVNAKSIAANP